MKLVIYGLTVTSSWGNGHATTFRSLLRALHARGHEIVFVEKDVEWYRSHRDLPHPAFCRVHLYEDWQREEKALVREASDADAVIIGSYFPDAIQAAGALRAAGVATLLFYDIDTPVTMAAIRREGRCDYLTAAMIPQFSAYLSFTGGPTLQELETRFGSPKAVPFYCSVDASIYRPSPTRDAYRCTMSYLGTYAVDRQPKLMELLNRVAGMREEDRFLVAGPMYPVDLQWARNVDRIDHVAPPDHPSFYSSSRWTLNLTREDMVQAGYSPSVRLFEASACGTAIVSDTWPGLETFFTAGEEIVLANGAADVAAILSGISDEERLRLGSRARERILAEHTAEHRAEELEAIVSGCSAGA